MNKQKWIAYIPLFMIIGFVYMIFSAKQELQYHSCHMPMATSEDELLLSGCGQFMRVSRTGEIIDHFPFERLGLSPQIYSIDISDSGDIILADMGGRAVKACDPDLSNCRVLISAESGGELRRPFSLQHWGEQLYIADPNNNRIVVYGANNSADHYIQHEFNYPSHFYLSEKELIVADSGNHRIAVFDRDDSNGFTLRDTIDVKALRSSADATRPLGITVDNEGKRWIIMADHLMVGQDIVVLSQDNTILNTVTLPNDAEPFGIVIFDNQVLVSNPENEALYSIDENGAVAPYAPGSAVARQLEQSAQVGREVKNKYMTGFIGSLICLLAFILIRMKSSSPHETGRAVREIHVNPSNPTIHWIETENKKNSVMSIVGYSLLIFIPMGYIIFGGASDNVVSSALREEPFAIVSLLTMALIVAAIIVPISLLKNLRLGILDKILILQTADKKIIVAEAKDVAYSENLIFIGEKTINLKSMGKSLFPKDQLDEYIYPLLKEATCLEPEQAVRRVMTLKGTQKYLVVAFVVILMLGFSYILQRYFL